jgi:hypothetical protein
MAVCSLQKSQKAVYIWLAANLLQRSALHKLAYHSQIGKRSFTRPVSPDLYTDHARRDRIVTREKRKLEWCSEASISSLQAQAPHACHWPHCHACHTTATDLHRFQGAGHPWTTPRDPYAQSQP